LPKTTYEEQLFIHQLRLLSLIYITLNESYNLKMGVCKYDARYNSIISETCSLWKCSCFRKIIPSVLQLLVANCPGCQKQQWRSRKEWLSFFLWGVSFICLAVGFTFMVYRSEAKQLF